MTQPPSSGPAVSLADDGDVPEPIVMADRLLHATRRMDARADYYGNGGAVAEFEHAIARHLGKERAVMFPTGTIANLVAVTCLTRARGKRVVVHRLSHLYNDCGDNLPLLGGFALLPLDNGGGGFSAEQVRHELARTADARVASEIGCIAVESPNRRLFGRRFNSDDLRDVCDLASENEVPLFLDGARMLIECAYTGVSPNEMAAPFDLVYMSLYKYLGAPFGCVLAGPAALLDGIFHERRRYGGSLYQMWPAAVLAAERLPRIAGYWADTIPASEAVIGRLERDPRLQVERVPEGTNIFLVSRRDAALDGPKIKAEGARLGLKMPEPVDNRLPIKINETWLNMEADQLAGLIASALTSDPA